MIKKVKPERIYNLTNMREDSVFPWVGKKYPAGYAGVVIDDKFGENILKAKITGKGQGRSYKIKGKNIIKFLIEKNQDGKIKIKRREKGRKENS